ncbi:hypothetical protein EYZ11_013411 [Aspergillus tanneri]|uniref:Uncharacterized protein n=1 Tax=Aspergillus tanneri TaxID=1220188 RepID=A0A4S3IY93_9EURO|nr:hypothetical protein EYZ11_013411 [Aspergillus tanneri]
MKVRERSGKSADRKGSEEEKEAKKKRKRRRKGSEEEKEAKKKRKRRRKGSEEEKEARRSGTGRSGWNLTSRGAVRGSGPWNLREGHAEV